MVRNWGIETLPAGQTAGYVFGPLRPGDVVRGLHVTAGASQIDFTASVAFGSAIGVFTFVERPTAFNAIGPAPEDWFNGEPFHAGLITADAGTPLLGGFAEGYSYFPIGVVVSRERYVGVIVHSMTSDALAFNVGLDVQNPTPQ